MPRPSRNEDASVVEAALESMDAEQLRDLV